jgi:putative cell wall-binding protein
VTVTRIGGPDRDATANLISEAMFPAAQSARAVILARDDVFADALAGSPMSAAFVGPVLLTPTNSLGSSARAGIIRVLVPGGTVYVLGGTAAVSTTVADQLKQLGYAIVRIGGRDRYETATLIAQKLTASGPVQRIYLATGMNFPDALAAASAAGSGHGVILLTADNVMPAVTSTWMAAHAGVPVVAVGAQAAKAAPSASQLVGPDRYATATAVAADSYPHPAALLLATGRDFPDALAGAAYGAQQGWGLLLVDPGTTTLSTVQATYLLQAGGTVTSVVILGGLNAVPDAAATLIVQGLRAA